MTRGDYLASFDRVNLCSEAKPGSIDPRQYHSAAENLGASLLVGRRVVMLGPNVASCFGISRNSYEWCQWHGWNERAVVPGWRVDKYPPFHWCVIPHPSGRNLLYNDPVIREMTGSLLRSELQR